MTGYTVHTGTSKKFVSGWDRVFSKAEDGKDTGRTSGKSEPAKSKKNKKRK